MTDRGKKDVAIRLTIDLIKNKNGKAGAAIVVLCAIIILAAVPWFMIISKNLSGDIPYLSPAPFDDNGDGLQNTDQSGDQNDAAGSDAPTPNANDDNQNNLNARSLPTGPLSPFDAKRIDISEAMSDMPEILDQISSAYNSAAVSLVVYDGDTGEYFTYEYGHADIEAKREAMTDTKFRVASLSKVIVAICALYLVDEGYIDLDTDVSNYFGYEVRNVHFPDTPITTRMLMQHTSSIFDSGAYQVSRDRNSSEPVKYLIERGSSYRRNKPGTFFEYSNFGYAVLGSMCERVTGKTLDTLSREIIFEPLGIDAAFVAANIDAAHEIAVIYDSDHTPSRSVQSQLGIEQSDIPGNDLHLAHGSLTISAFDFARILAMLGSEGSFDDVMILSAESTQEFHDANVEGYDYMQGLATRYSVGGFIDNEGFYWHTGSSYGIYAQYVYQTNPNRGVVVITTGASIARLESGMIDLCTDLALAAWDAVF
ncbi:MAG: beta-lactamase family protein [Oscillospiraceae bacterium]|nr:beta-lactamase family protein [Oscillospiraceae bacterium]